MVVIIKDDLVNSKPLTDHVTIIHYYEAESKVCWCSIKPMSFIEKYIGHKIEFQKHKECKKTECYKCTEDESEKLNRLNTYLFVRLLDKNKSSIKLMEKKDV
jgi:hypothetical protein